VWVLGPDDRRERFRRLLQIQKDELDYDVKYTDVLTSLRDDDKREFRSLSGKLREEAELKRQKQLATTSYLLQIFRRWCPTTRSGIGFAESGRDVHPAAHPLRLSTAAAHPAPEPHGAEPMPIAARSP
jgi:hypothetical protein